MEIYSNTTRFCFACNQSNKIIDPIQSRCAILRYGKLRDEEVLTRLIQIAKSEKVSMCQEAALLLGQRIAGVPMCSQRLSSPFKVEYSEEGLGALLFTAEGDMRQAINNLQSTWTGLGFVSPDNVFKVCDQPHPVLIRDILRSCQDGDIDTAIERLDDIWANGYSALDVVTTLFRVVKTLDSMPEALKLDYIREIGWTHMRILEGVSTLVQLGGLLARLAKMAHKPEAFVV